MHLDNLIMVLTEEERKARKAASQKKWRENNPSYQTKYYEKNKDEIDARVKKWRENNKDKMNIINKRYIENNKDKVRATKKKYRAKNRQGKIL